jgi:hypothetical protein
MINQISILDPLSYWSWMMPVLLGNIQTGPKSEGTDA